jgi:catechol 2,3-dioxygenase-like lactoylglutathione lyase family enzyme
MNRSEHRRGGIARRNVLAAIPALIAAPAAARAAIITRRLNNVMIAVSDLDRSSAFYQRLFGTPARQGGVAIFRVGEGPHFFGLTQAPAGIKPDFLSYGMTVDNFDAAQMKAELSGLGVADVQISDRDGTAEFFLHDPNGVQIQLQHTSYGHGTGPLGNGLPAPPRFPSKPAFQLRTVNHVTLTATQGAKSLEFYQSIFGLPVGSRQGTTASLKIGAGPESVVFNTAANTGGTGGINHACFTISNFDPARAMGILVDNGLEPIEFGNPALIKPLTCRVRLRQRAANGGGPTSPLGTPELYFTDPDNIAIQLQDVSYCGGSGWLGQICR